MDEHIVRARRILNTNKYMVLATASSENTPWSTPVFFAFDEKYNFYWYSRKDAKHSLSISKNNQVSACIFGIGNSDEGFGVYIKGKAVEITNDDLLHATKVYAEKAATNAQVYKQLTTVEDFLNESILRMYKLVPDKMYISNESTKWKGKWIDTRSEIFTRSG